MTPCGPSSSTAPSSPRTRNWWITGLARFLNEHGAGDDIQEARNKGYDLMGELQSACLLEEGRPWTVEEHRRFLESLTAKGKSNWKAIAQDFVKTRNLMQLATHAQKYFLRQGASPSRRPSVFNLAIETV
ncbi:hypothetical protein Taro_017695 [Colocasia esculenta]|uniref:Uncharacterized protein n=1 Tax=Colocasia esculenta TaxID=4460 RepID=A0A843URZ9_COLES|nr:hypothetical protein [Colocasia esculenta]